MPSGIYQIRNLVNNKRYIGQAINLRKRECEHFCKLNKNTHYNQILQNSYNKHGRENFVFEILEIIENNNRELLEKMLTEREQYYINLYNIETELYNLLPIAKSGRGHKHSEESKLKMSRNRTGNKNHMFGKRGAKSPNSIAVAQINSKTGEIIATFSSMIEARQAVGLKDSSGIINVCRKKQKSAGGYFWKYLSEDLKKFIPLKDNKCHAVVQLNLQTREFIAEFPSITEAAKAIKFKNIAGISEVCRGNEKSAGGYFWRYSVEYFFINGDFIGEKT